MMHFPRRTHTLNLRGRLMDLSVPKVMGIVNVTPDSFYSESRIPSEAHLLRRVEQLLEDGMDILDLGGCSTRPGIELASEEVETERLCKALTVLRAQWPELPISVDTFRARVAEKAVREFDVDLINDISGGDMDAEMYPTVARLKVPYILMHMQGTPTTMQANPHYDDLLAEIALYFSRRVARLRSLGVSDIVLDPGFGFGKTVPHNYELLRRLDELQLFELPLLVGVSRKSMIYKTLGGGPDDALNGTTVLNTLALCGGAGILRVHDVKAAKECVTLFEAFRSPGPC
jgi:dihydropteroate synthase